MSIKGKLIQVVGSRPDKKEKYDRANEDKPRISSVRRRRTRRGFSRSARLGGSIRAKRFLRFPITWEVEIKIQIRIYTSGLLLKSEPPRCPLSTRLVPQLPNHLIPLGNHVCLLKEVCAQPTTFLTKPFR